MCLGILFDTVNRTISMPPEKLQEILTLNVYALLAALMCMPYSLLS